VNECTSLRFSSLELRDLTQKLNTPKLVHSFTLNSELLIQKFHQLTCLKVTCLKVTVRELLRVVRVGMVGKSTVAITHAVGMQMINIAIVLY